MCDVYATEQTKLKENKSGWHSGIFILKCFFIHPIVLVEFICSVLHLSEGDQTSLVIYSIYLLCFLQKHVPSKAEVTLFLFDLIMLDILFLKQTWNSNKHLLGKKKKDKTVNLLLCVLSATVHTTRAITDAANRTRPYRLKHCFHSHP